MNLLHETPVLKSTQYQQNANLLQEKPVLKFTQNRQQFLQESSQTPLKAEFLAIKCFVIDELYNLVKILKRFQRFYREYTKNLWDEIASKNTIINLLTKKKKRKKNYSTRIVNQRHVTNHRNIM